ncbi:MAG: hypothetical protein L3J03_00190 [Desulfobacterales bacterium]|nr:hypothetical protein [Desulfobacterales bacterium]
MRVLPKSGKTGGRIWLLILGMALFLAGCAEMNFSGQGDETLAPPAPAPAPYAAVDFQDIQVPAELTWDRENSMSIKTESFAGGTLKFDGRVEVNSLVDFFVNSMANNQWKLVGSVKYENILLAFTKPYKTCTISIFENKYSGKTSVYIYVTDDIAARTGMNPGGGSTFR